MSPRGQRRHLLIFARDPIAGQVKTRLIPAIGEAGAATLYRRLLDNTLATGTQVAADRHELWVDRANPTPGLVARAEKFGMSVHIQSGPDLGARMHAAFAESLRTANRAVLIGTDCPEYDADYLDAAFQALEGHDVVIGPARDGGYVLIGLRVVQAELFRDIPWGTADVLAATRDRIQHRHLRSYELPVRHDVDQPEDLLRFPHLLSAAESGQTGGPHE